MFGRRRSRCRLAQGVRVRPIRTAPEATDPHARAANLRCRGDTDRAQRPRRGRRASAGMIVPAVDLEDCASSSPFIR